MSFPDILLVLTFIGWAATIYWLRNAECQNESLRKRVDELRSEICQGSDEPDDEYASLDALEEIAHANDLARAREIAREFLGLMPDIRHPAVRKVSA